MDKVVVTSDPLSTSHQTTLAPQCEVGEGVLTSFELSHPPIPPTLDICAYLVFKPIRHHVLLSFQTQVFGSINPSDFTMLCSPVPNSTSCVHKINLSTELML